MATLNCEKVFTQNSCVWGNLFLPEAHFVAMSYVGIVLFHNILNEIACSERVGIVEEAKLFWG